MVKRVPGIDASLYYFSISMKYFTLLMATLAFCISLVNLYSHSTGRYQDQLDALHKQMQFRGEEYGALDNRVSGNRFEIERLLKNANIEPFAWEE